LATHKENVRDKIQKPTYNLRIFGLRDKRGDGKRKKRV
jgi:hypothetical protein